MKNGKEQPVSSSLKNFYNILGPGVWIFTRWQPDELVELVRIIENSVVVNISIRLVDNGNGTCTGIWELKFTALNERGNQMVTAIPDEDPLLTRIIEGLGYFLKIGELMPIARALSTFQFFSDVPANTNPP